MQRAAGYIRLLVGRFSHFYSVHFRLSHCRKSCSGARSLWPGSPNHRIKTYIGGHQYIGCHGKGRF